MSHEPAKYVVVLQLLPEKQSLDRLVVVSQQGHQVLEQESLAEVEQVQRLVHLDMKE